MTQAQLEGLMQLRELLRGNAESLRAFLSKQHPADLGEWLEDLTDQERKTIFELLDPDQAAPILSELELSTQADIVAALGSQKAGLIVEEMPSDEAADLIAELSPEAQGQILGQLEAEDAADVRGLLEYGSDTAGGIMDPDCVRVCSFMTAQQAIEHLRRLSPVAEYIYYVYVVDHQERLVGVISLRELIVARPGELVGEIAEKNVVSVSVDQDQEEVARVVSKYDLLAVPVVDRDQKLVGVITVDDVIDVIHEENTRDALQMSAVNPDAQPVSVGAFKATIWELARPRLPWLVALLFMEVASGQVINYFQHGFTPVTLAVLTVFITTMAGEAGNAATQALAVVVRSLAMGEISTSDILKVVWRELQVGVLVGAICGSVLAGLAYVWQHDVHLALTVGLALSINIPVAKILGAFFPILIQRVGLDPAVASGPFITTVTDVTAMFTYFGIASIILSI